MRSQQILIVDDDPDAREVFAQFLQLAGYNTISAASAQDALSTIHSADISLVITDFLLPDLSGIDLLQRERSSGNTTPFIIVTGVGSGQIAASAFKCGATDYLEKPVDECALLAATRNALKSPCTDGHADISHAGTRLATLIVRVLSLRSDPKTLTLWGRGIGMSEGALRNICYTAHVGPKNALRFARVLRAVHRQRQNIRPEDVLDIVDLRTLSQLLKLGDGKAVNERLPATIHDFISSQRWITDDHTLRSIEQGVTAFLDGTSPRMM